MQDVTLPLGAQELIAELMSLPDSIAAAETGLTKSAVRVATFKERLELHAAQLYEDGEITGSNEAARKAKERALTVQQRRDLATAQEIVDHEAILVRRLQNRLSALRSVCDVMRGKL